MAAHVQSHHDRSALCITQSVAKDPHRAEAAGASPKDRATAQEHKADRPLHQQQERPAVSSFAQRLQLHSAFLRSNLHPMDTMLATTLHRICALWEGVLGCLHQEGMPSM